MNARARKGRRILREHRRDEPMHWTKLDELCWQIWFCAHCARREPKP